MKSISDSRPKQFVKLGDGSWHYNYNIKEKLETVHHEDENVEPKTYTVYECDTLHIWSPVQPKVLKLAEILPEICGKTPEEIKLIDIKFIEKLHNFKRYSRGYKIYSKYYAEPNFTDGETTPAVERIYSLVKDEAGNLTGEKVLMKWFNTDGTVAFTKENIENYSAKDAAKILKDIRETRILYLQNAESEFVNPTVKAYIDMLFQHYKQQVSDYILNGSKDFENAINNEQDAQVIQILSAVLADGKTVKESILYQIVEL